jgi:enoyl-CoA hydratase/carnithine racemase
MMSGFETVIYEKNDNIAYVTLNRPQALNAFSVQMRDDLYEVLRAIKADDEVRVVVLKGAGDKAFCAGADLKEFLTAPSVVKARQIRGVRDLWRLFLSMPQPLIAALQGYVLGSGIEISLYCDLRIATPDSVFGLPEVSLGILPAAGGTQVLPRILGLSGALDMLLTGRRLSGEEAFNMGMVQRLAPSEQLLATVDEMARKIASYDPMAVRNVK